MTIKEEHDLEQDEAFRMDVSTKLNDLLNALESSMNEPPWWRRMIYRLFRI